VSVQILVTVIDNPGGGTIAYAQMPAQHKPMEVSEQSAPQQHGEVALAPAGDGKQVQTADVSCAIETAGN